MTLLPSDYALRRGSTLDRAALVKFMQRTYQELYPAQPLAHLAETVEQHLASDTPLWWVELHPAPQTVSDRALPVACLWVGNAIDQLQGDRHAHIFLLYVDADHRRRGIGAALMNHAEQWAKERGDRQIGLQVFQTNQPALNLYTKLGYTPQSVWMVKSLRTDDERSRRTGLS